ncbi:MAG: hypothetical protein ABW075_13810 [Aeromicrobium sp.]
MTTTELCGILRRRWYVVVLGLALLVGALHVVVSRPGAYWTQVDVVILAPKSARFPNVIGQTSQSLIAMAGLLERDLNRGIERPAAASSSVTLAGLGVRQGHTVTLPNSGGQWANSFNRPVLDLQVIGPSETTVRAELDALVDRVHQRLAAIQAADRIPRGSRITASSSPASAAVFHLQGNRTKAIGATLLLGVVLIAVGTVGADRLLTARARHRRDVLALHLLGGSA